MPLTPPPIDDRRFAQLVQDTLGRAQSYTPEWTNFNQSDPGVTLVQLFAFLTENLLYRANLMPERNRIKFLQMLRVPLTSASAAQGPVAITNDRGPMQAQLVAEDFELRAGAVPFRTQMGVEVLPLEARVVFKRTLPAPSAELLDYYRLLYASYQTDFPTDVQLYETVALDGSVVESVDLNQDTPDRSLWIALLARAGDVDPSAADPLKAARDLIGGRTLSLGVVPALDDVGVQIAPGGPPQASTLLTFEVPSVAADGSLSRDADDRPAPAYRQLAPSTDADVLAEPGVVQLQLPASADLAVWDGVDALEGGVGDLPPVLDDPALAARTVTWLRMRITGAAQARIRWAGLNATWVRQIEHTVAEPLADGDGTPGQVRTLAHAPILDGSVTVTARVGTAAPTTWTQIDDLAAAAPEVPVSDPRATTLALPAAPVAPSYVFELDAEAGELTFGDGFNGWRLPAGAKVFANSDTCSGAAGNVQPGAINSAPLLGSGFSVTNPVQTWGGADAETADDGDKQVRRYLQHRDRLVSAEDFATIAYRAPGVQIGRIEVLPAFHPDFAPAEPGGAPGVVTLMAIPAFDPGQPDAPRADRLFLNTLCVYLDPRRLVTTELLLRGPDYIGIWISVGVDVAAGLSIAAVVDAAKTRLQAFLAPIGPAGGTPDDTPLFAPPGSVDPARGWPLRTAVSSRVLLAEVARVAGVTSVADVLLAQDGQAASDSVAMTGLQLPRVLGISVVAGDPVPIDAVRGVVSATPAAPTQLLPVPIVPENC